jgi:fructose-1-phosphate kinase PfkB-like protein
VVVTATGSHRLTPSGVRGAYPVGSGDAFLGGLAVGFARGDDTVDAARLGLAAGAANALIPGAGELDPLDVDRLLREMPNS